METLSKLELLLCRTCVTLQVVHLHEAAMPDNSTKRDTKVFEELNEKLLRMIREE